MWNEELVGRQDEREVLGSELEADWEGRDGRDGGDFEVFRTSISNFTF